MTNVRDILLQFDEVGSYEGSKTIDYVELRKSIGRLVERLNARFATRFVLDDQVQDASFQCDIELPSTLLLPHPSYVKGTIRISSFGKLASICFEELISADHAIAVKDELGKEGFIYVPADALDIEYDGQFEEFKQLYGGRQKATWWIRYFDYI